MILNEVGKELHVGREFLLVCFDDRCAAEGKTSGTVGIADGDIASEVLSEMVLGNVGIVVSVDSI